VGVLFVVATAFLFVGEAIYKPVLSSPDYLDIVYPNRSRVIVGILLEMTCVLAIPLIPIVFFPVLKCHNEALALGYLVFRTIEAVILIGIAEINKLSLIGISQDYLSSGAEDASYLRHIGSAVQSENYWADTTGLVYNIVFVIGALMLYSILYRSNLIPRFISGWGFFGAGLLLIGAVASAFDELSLTMTIIVVTPIAVQEMVMAAWFIFKGFNPSAIQPESGARPVS
jgi:hypothetical protein